MTKNTELIDKLLKNDKVKKDMNMGMGRLEHEKKIGNAAVSCSGNRHIHGLHC